MKCITDDFMVTNRVPSIISAICWSKATFKRSSSFFAFKSIKIFIVQYFKIEYVVGNKTKELLQ